ncbi:MAG: winged helix-turn-helix domain-containing protein [Halothece sp.]
MAVPDYQSLMFPLLSFCNDANEHNAQEAIDALTTQFQLTATEKNELLPSGKQPRFAKSIPNLYQIY